MNKCLLTKLDVVVNDNNLPYIDRMKMAVNTIGATEAKRVIMLYSNPNVFENGTITVKTLDDSKMLSVNSDFSNPTNEVTFKNFYTSTFKFLYFLEGSFSISVTTTNLSGIELGSGGSEITHPVSFNIDAFKYTGLEILRANYAGGVTGKIENIPCSIKEISLMSTNVEGDIISLGNCLNLTNIRVYKTKHLTGDIANLAQAMYDNGRVSGNMTVRVYDSAITINGEYTAFQSTQNIVFSESGYEVEVVNSVI